LAAAEAAAATTLSYLLNPERAARLIEYNARDARQPGFLAVAGKLIEKTWKKPLVEGYTGELQTIVNNLVLKNLLQLAATSNASELVKRQTLLIMEELKNWIQGKTGQRLRPPKSQYALCTYAGGCF
jgi:hypothetical protein